MNRNVIMALVVAPLLMTGLTSCAKEKEKAVQKRYSSQAECQRDFPMAGDCTRSTVTNGGFMSPFFFPSGTIIHSNGFVDYDRKVPKSGYTVLPANVQSNLAKNPNLNMSRVSSSGTVRGGFGGSARGFSAGG